MSETLEYVDRARARDVHDGRDGHCSGCICRAAKTTPDIRLSAEVPFLPLDDAIASRAVFLILSGSDGRTDGRTDGRAGGRTEMLLEPA